ncbi:hypothetical protein CK203_020291 [Vitis vinifera]|uniref:Proline-rich protein 2 n=1 Tax=Vitis vinifera TaxID=29760 RepID=A0A438IIK1_VITVI|nr:hypothetical protein CK203_020291 [Vitis vinifera]
MLGIIRGLGFPIWTQPICERGTSRPLGGTAIFCELLPLQCADCAESNINTSQALSGLGLTIDCKLENGEFKTRKVGDINQEGKFRTMPCPEWPAGLQVHKKPLSSPVPIHKKTPSPPVMVHKKSHPPAKPVFKKPWPPPVPVVKKPLPSSVPIYKKPLSFPLPIHKPIPAFYKPLPPLPPVYMKPFSS